LVRGGPGNRTLIWGSKVKKNKALGRVYRVKDGSVGEGIAEGWAGGKNRGSWFTSGQHSTCGRKNEGGGGETRSPNMNRGHRKRGG